MIWYEYLGGGYFMYEKLISVIIAVYNNEKYVDSCLKSIASQTYGNIEIIVVDDGSTDNSFSICKEWESRDSRIKLVSQENGGVARARNRGLDIATGEYIFFVDSDDCIDANILAFLYSAIERSGCKVSQCDFTSFTDDCEINIHSDYVETVLQVTRGKEMISKIYSSEGPKYTVVWNKLYSSECWKEIRFPEGKIHEDLFVTYLVYAKYDVCVIDLKLYFYRANPNSIMHSTFRVQRLDMLEAIEKQMDFFLQVDKELYNMTLHHYTFTLMDYIFCVKRYMRSDKAILDELYEKYRKAILLSKACGISLPKFSAAFRISPWLYHYTKRIYEIIKDN